VQILENTARQNTEIRSRIADTLLRIFEAKNRAPLLCKLLISLEVVVADDVETLWRGNSIASKALDSYMKQAAHLYLGEVVSGVINQIWAMKSPLDENDKHSDTLIETLEEFLVTLAQSVDSCPQY